VRRRQAKKNLRREIAAIITPLLRQFALDLVPALMAGRAADRIGVPDTGRRNGKNYVRNLLTEAARLGARRARP
jgi:hypothetical protein